MIVEMQFAAVADADDQQGIAEAQTITHDRLLAICGDRRRSGVEWIHIDNASIEEAWLDNLLERTTEVEVGAVETLREFLRANPSGLFIIASCKAIERE